MVLCVKVNRNPRDNVLTFGKTVLDCVAPLSGQCAGGVIRKK
jgi:hypothetical protein